MKKILIGVLVSLALLICAWANKPQKTEFLYCFTNVDC